MTILAAVDAARLDLDPDAEPAGRTPRRGFATAVRASLLRWWRSWPRAAACGDRDPEYEPLEAFALLADDDLDLALTYDYNLAPASPARRLSRAAVDHAVGPRGPARRWPAATGQPISSAGASARGSSTPATPPTWTPCAHSASMAGFTPHISHQIDSLDLVEDLIVAGQGVGLLPLDRPTGGGVRVLPLPTRRW